MSAPVDVLAVNAAALRDARRLTVKQAHRVSDELHEAHAAFAALVQEARIALGALQEVASDKCPGTIYALRAALTRAGGAA
ncbi:MAG TPA: hypothetical protein VGC24_03700 [Burkholderiaceae bacterium]